MTLTEISLLSLALESSRLVWTSERKVQPKVLPESPTPKSYPKILPKSPTQKSYPKVLPKSPIQCSTCLFYPMFYPHALPDVLPNVLPAYSTRCSTRCSTACLLCLPLIVACCPLSAPEGTLTSFKISFGLPVTVTFTVVGIPFCIPSLLNVLSL